MCTLYIYICIYLCIWYVVYLKCISVSSCRNILGKVPYLCSLHCEWGRDTPYDTLLYAYTLVWSLLITYLQRYDRMDDIFITYNLYNYSKQHGLFAQVAKHFISYHIISYHIGFSKCIVPGRLDLILPVRCDRSVSTKTKPIDAFLLTDHGWFRNKSCPRLTSACVRLFLHETNIFCCIWIRTKVIAISYQWS